MSESKPGRKEPSERNISRAARLLDQIENGEISFFYAKPEQNGSGVYIKELFTRKQAIKLFGPESEYWNNHNK